MSYRLSYYCVNILRCYTDINTEDMDIYIFGIEMIIMHIFHFMLMMLLGIILKKPVETLMFIGIYSKMRTTAGGQHFKSKSLCFFTSIALIAIVVFPIKIQELMFLLQLKWTIFLLFCGISCVYMFAPCDNCNKPMDNIEKEKYRNQTILLIGVFGLLYFMSVYVYPVVSYIIAISFFLEGIGLIWGTMQNRKV